jgi:hypothetical protein
MTISALRPITSGEQIFVSYIDATNPYHVRQAELQDRYFFTCKCTKCSSDLMNKQTILHTPEADENLLVENRAFELLSLARKDTSITGPIQKLRYGIHILRKTYSRPLYQQPLASLRQELVVSLTTAGQLHLALIHAWIQYRLIDPKLMPEKDHPISLIHQWLIVSLLRRIDPLLGRPEDLPIQKYNILERSIDIQTIISYIFGELSSGVYSEDSPDVFSLIVRCSYRWSAGTYPSVSRAEFEREAEKLSLCANEILDQELVWGDAT